MASSRRYTCLSIFSGACGLDVGFERTGRFRSLGCLEYNPVFCETIRRNRDAGRLGIKSMPVFEGDIKEIDPTKLMGQCGVNPGDLDLLIGGPPCQSFSTAGRRRTVQDPRGELLWQFLRYVVAMRPRFFVLENVRGLLSAALRHRPIAERPERGGPPLEQDEKPGSVVQLWIDDLRRETDNEYRVDCFEVNAVNYGAPQLRERAIFIGNRLGIVVDYPQPTHGPPGSQQKRLFGEPTPFRSLRDAIGDLHDESPVLLDFSPRKKKYLGLVPPGGNWRSLHPDLQKESMGKAWYAKGGRSGWWRRLSWDLPCPTIVTMPNHASTSMCHPAEVRVLSLAECAATQEFPLEWEFAGTVQQQYEQVGNAVPIRLGVVTGECLAHYLDLYTHQNAPPVEVANGYRGAVSALAPPFRRVYLRSHVRTRQWYKDGKVFIWNDGGDNGDAQYSPNRRKSKA